MEAALRRSGPAIIASGATTIIGLLCLLAADLNSTQGLGPIGAAGSAGYLWPESILAVRAGVRPGCRRAYSSLVGYWLRIAIRPRLVWIGTAAVLVLLSLGLVGDDTHLGEEDRFTNEPESITGQKILAESFPAGASASASVLANAIVPWGNRVVPAGA